MDLTQKISKVFGNISDKKIEGKIAVGKGGENESKPNDAFMNKKSRCVRQIKIDWQNAKLKT